MTFREFSKQQVPRIDDTMIHFLTETTTEKNLLESMIYSIQAGGKRFRPLLLLATIDFLGEPLKNGAYQVASALEMVHCYSLIHDDLPAMDDDSLRRGKPTNHKVFGEATAILAGDGLLTEAFHLVAKSDLTADIKNQLLGDLAKASGTHGMIAGQMLDISNENKKISLSELKQMHGRKTGALIEFAVSAGSQLGSAPVAVKEHLKVFAEAVGIAFQIRDDLLDVIGDETVIGKKIGADAKLNKSTYVSLLGLEGAEHSFQQTCTLAQGSLQEAKKLMGITQQTILEMILEELMVIDK